MGQAARQRCVENFTLQHSTDRWRDLIDEELAQTSGGGRL
jgi:hypothetical protein